MTRPQPSPDLPFESELGAYLASLPSEVDLDVDRLRERFPEHVERIEDLLPVLAAVREALGEPARVSERIEAAYGPGSDPQLSLDPDERAEDGSGSAELLDRLSHQAPEDGRYEPLGEVARGGMGVVFRVWDADLRRRLAMKVLLPKRKAALDDPAERSRTLSRFLEEATDHGSARPPRRRARPRTGDRP